MNPQQRSILDRGQRLISLCQSPGIEDLKGISQKLAEEAQHALIAYQGWDKDQLQILQATARAMSQHHERLFQVIEETIDIVHRHSMGVSEPVEKLERISADEAEEVRKSFLVGV